MSFRNTPTLAVDLDGTVFHYRELGPKGGVPIVLLNHVTAVLDEWDPVVVDGLAARHHVIAFDNRGVGGTNGTTPDSIDKMAQDSVAFIRALNHGKVDLFGFSLGDL